MRAFVFGGGSSRGALQIGALEVLFEHGIKPAMLMGSSIGGINAAFIAANPTTTALEGLKELYVSTGHEIFQGNKASALLKVVSGDGHLFDNDTLLEMLEENLEARHFGDLELPCYVMAADLDTAELCVFGDAPDDSLLDALMATSAMIPVYPPWQSNGRFYGDGGLVANLPVQQAIERGATEVIAFNLTNQLRSSERRQNVIDLFFHDLDLLLHGQVQAELAFARQKKDVNLILLDLTTDDYIDFTDLDEMEALFARGRELAQAMLEQHDLGE